MCRGQSQCELGYLDAYYTKDPDGNGWFVPYVRNSDGLADKALCVLNLLSPVVNDRATVTRKLERVGDKVVRAIDLPYLQAKEALGLGTNDQNRGRVINRGNPVDVQFGAARMLRPVFTYMAFACCAAWEAAAEASLALSVYRTQHGHYPERLADLVPEYLPSLPIDPVTREPLGYRLDKMEEYKLYCAGDDGVDNNARSYDQFALGCYGKSPSDLVFSGPARDKPAIEWYLVPTEDTDNHSATSQP